MGSKNNVFVGSEKRFGRSTDECAVGLGLRRQQQVEESCPNRSFMPHHHNSHNNQRLSSSSCCADGFDGGASDGGPIVCNTSNQVACTGDIYDVVGSASASASASAAAVLLKSLHYHPFSSDPSFPQISSGSGEMAAPVNARSVPFTAAQWQELERQTMIYKYMVASLPVPPELLIPLTRKPSNVVKGPLELGFPSNIGSDPEPWRCRRTDGKKWRCSRDVAPDQKYCERHSHKSRPRSRKPVELPNHSINNNNRDHKSHTLNTKQQPPQNPHFINQQTDAHLFTSSFDQPRCLEWFMKGETTVPLASNSNPDQWQQFKTQATKFGGNVGEHQHQFIDHGLNFQAHQNLNEPFKYPSQETRSFIDAWSTAEREVGSKGRPVSSNEKQLPLSSLTLSMSGGNGNYNQEEDDENSEMGGFGIMGLATENGRALRAPPPPPPPQVVDPNLWMGSPRPGGPLAEALCLGIASSQSTSTSSYCSKRT